MALAMSDVANPNDYVAATAVFHWAAIPKWIRAGRAKTTVPMRAPTTQTALPLFRIRTVPAVLAHAVLLAVAGCGGEVGTAPPGPTPSPAPTSSAPTTADAGAAPASLCGPGLQAGSPWPMYGGCPSLQGRSLAVGPAQPTIRWLFTPSSAAVGQPAIGADNTVYFGTARGTLYALASDSTPRWTFQAGPGEQCEGTPAIAADGSILFSVGLASPKLYALSPDGALKWTFGGQSNEPDGFTSPTIGPDGTIYVMDSASLYAIHPDGTQAWAISNQPPGGGSQRPRSVRMAPSTPSGRRAP